MSVKGITSKVRKQIKREILQSEEDIFIESHDGGGGGGGNEIWWLPNR